MFLGTIIDKNFQILSIQQQIKAENNLVIQGIFSFITNMKFQRDCEFLEKKFFCDNNEINDTSAGFFGGSYHRREVVLPQRLPFCTFSWTSTIVTKQNTHTHNKIRKEYLPIICVPQFC